MKKSSENIAGFFRWTTRPNPLSINYIYCFRLYISVKLKNLKANHNSKPISSDFFAGLYISVKLKNLKANHNLDNVTEQRSNVVYICKVKKSESKSQLNLFRHYELAWLYISVKLKNLKANHNTKVSVMQFLKGCIYL